MSVLTVQPPMAIGTFSPVLANIWNGASNLNVNIVLDEPQKTTLVGATSWGKGNPFHTRMAGIERDATLTRIFNVVSETDRNLTGQTAIDSFMLVFAQLAAGSVSTSDKSYITLLGGLLIVIGPDRIMSTARSLAGYPWFEKKFTNTVQRAAQAADQLLRSANLFVNGHRRDYASLESYLDGKRDAFSSLKVVFKPTLYRDINEFSDDALADALAKHGYHARNTARDLNVSPTSLSERMTAAPQGSRLYDIKRDPAIRTSGRKRRVFTTDEDRTLADEIKANGFNLTRAARKLGISPSTVSDRLSSAPAGSPLAGIKTDDRYQPVGRKRNPTPAP